ncbi:MAG: ABC-F family ATP-binding cassette domain-containing protein [Treponemataceae bacterium]
MVFVQLSKISLSFGERDILKDVTLILSEGSKAALTGANGAGKSTLMKIIAGLQTFDEGEISVEKNTEVAYLPQSGIMHSGLSLYAEVEKAFSKAKKILADLDTVGINLETEKNLSEQKRLAENFYSLQVALEASGWHRREALINEVLAGLGFAERDMERLTDEFSGGWQMRIALAKILLKGADILVLDEPTNYLDLEARAWLENYLKNFKGGFLLISHDRAFLDATVNETYELFNSKLTKYSGSYTKYEEQRKLELAQTVKAYNEQQDEIKKTEDFIRRFRYNKSKAAMVQDRIRRLEKMDKIEIPEQFKKIKFSFPEAPHSGKIVLNLENISKSFGNKKVISNFDFVLEKNERLVLLGKNGAGKSTLLRIMAGQDNEFEGTRKEGAGIDIGYFSQDASAKLQGETKVISLIENEAPMELIPNLRNMLAAFLFRGDDIYKPISVLSGGEKSRLSLLRLLLKKHNLLILDEPTNHLDMHSQDALIDALKNFGGTIIFVSHDKEFIQKLATNVLELSPPSEDNFFSPSLIKNYPGTYDYYLYSRDAQQAEMEIQATSSKDFSKEKNKLDKKILSYAEQKALRAERQKLERREKALLKEIEELETKIAKAQNEFSKPEIYSDEEKSRNLATKINELKSKYENLLKDWEELAKRL